MIYIIPTKQGMGVELWGTHEDLNNLYDVIGKYWNDEDSMNLNEYENRNMLISGFVYEIRKSYEGNRLKRKSSHFSFNETNYFGVQISWVHFLFSLATIKYNMQYREKTKFDISMILQIEYWLESAMFNYDEIGARKLIGFIDDGIYTPNEYIYHYMRKINLDYFLLGGGKRNFRKLPSLLKYGTYITDEYKEYRGFLEDDAKKLNCQINEMDLDDDNINYENIKW